jgi:tetratricopeptide (TPR) repeat protein
MKNKAAHISKCSVGFQRVNYYADARVKIVRKLVNSAIDKGKALFYKGQMTLAVSSYSEAIALDPEYADAYYHRAFANRFLGLAQEEIDDFKKVLSLDSKHIATLYQISYTYSRLGRHEEALNAIDRVNEIAPEWHSYRVRCNINLALGNIEEAKLDEKKGWAIGRILY